MKSEAHDFRTFFHLHSLNGEIFFKGQSIARSYTYTLHTNLFQVHFSRWRTVMDVASCILEEGHGLQNTKYLQRLHHHVTVCHRKRMSDTNCMSPFSQA